MVGPVAAENAGRSVFISNWEIGRRIVAINPTAGGHLPQMQSSMRTWFRLQRSASRRRGSNLIFSSMSRAEYPPSRLRILTG